LYQLLKTIKNPLNDENSVLKAAISNDYGNSIVSIDEINDFSQ
jgi:hypothetical protein